MHKQAYHFRLVSSCYLSISNCIVKMHQKTTNVLQIIMHYSRPKEPQSWVRISHWKKSDIAIGVLSMCDGQCRKPNTEKYYWAWQKISFTTIRYWIFNNIDVRKRWHQPLAGLVCGVKWRSRQSPRPSNELNRTLHRTNNSTTIHKNTYQ